MQIKRRGTEWMVFGWPSDEPSGGMRDFLGVVENLNSPWKLARITDFAEKLENGGWEWTVDFIEVYERGTLEPAGAWWVDSTGTWRIYNGEYR